MFPSVDDQTKEILKESGELQRAYLVTLAHQEAYDAFMEKNKDVLSPEDCQYRASAFADSVVYLVFGQDKA